MANSRTIRGVVAVVLAAGLAITMALSAHAAFHLTVASRTSGGVTADADSNVKSNGGSISGDGSILAFDSRATNLPHGDGSTRRCYVRNLKSGKTRLVSVASDGEPATGDTQEPKISANGRFVTFFGDGDALPPAHTSDSQVWVHDLKTGKTQLASRTKKGKPARDGGSAYPSISGNGRFVAFRSYALNMPGGNGSSDISYVRDMKKGKTLVASVTSDGHAAPGDVYGQAISGDGRRVVFESNDADLPHGTGSFFHVYVSDLKTGKVSLVDRASDGSITTAGGTDASISANGRYVAFASIATELPSGTGTRPHVYLRDLKKGKTTLVSQTTAGEPQESDADYAHPSADGRYVAFSSDGANLPGGDGSNLQIYLRDMRQGTTRLISKAENGDGGDADSEYPSLSLDGRWIGFQSAATNFGGDGNLEQAFRAGPIG